LTTSGNAKVYLERHGIANFFKSGRYKTTPHWEKGSDRYGPFSAAA